MLIVHKSKPLDQKKLDKIRTRVEWGSKGGKRKTVKGTSANRWKGVRHGELLTALRAAVDGGTECPAAWVAHNGGDLAACFRAGRHWVGVTASNISLARLKVYCGLVGEDGTRLVSGVLTGSAYNRNFDLGSECGTLAAGWRDATHKCDADERDFKTCRLLPQESDRLLLAAGRDGLLPWKYLGLFAGAFADRPDTTAWDLLAAFSGTVSACPPLVQLERLHGFRCLLAKKVGIAKPEVA